MKTRFEWIRPLFQGTVVLTPSAPGPAQQFFGATDLPSLFNAGFRMALAIGAMLAVARLIYAGFLYMTTDLPGMKNNAKEIIGYAVGGLCLLLAVWLILYQINPQILNLNILQSATPLPAANTGPSVLGSMCPPGETLNNAGLCAPAGSPDVQFGPSGDRVDGVDSTGHGCFGAC